MALALDRRTGAAPGRTQASIREPKGAGKESSGRPIGGQEADTRRNGAVAPPNAGDSAQVVGGKYPCKLRFLK